MSFPHNEEDGEKRRQVEISPTALSRYPDACESLEKLHQASERLMSVLPASSTARIIGTHVEGFINASRRWLNLSAEDRWQGHSPEGKSPKDFLEIETPQDVKKARRRPLFDGSLTGIDGYAEALEQKDAEETTAIKLDQALKKMHYDVPKLGAKGRDIKVPLQGLLVSLSRACEQLDDAGMVLHQQHKPDEKTTMPRLAAGARKDPIRDPWAAKPKPERPEPAEDDRLTGALITGTRTNPLQKIAALREELDNLKSDQSPRR